MQQRTKLLAEYAVLPMAYGLKEGVAELEQRYGVARGYIAKYLLPSALSDARGAAPLSHQTDKRRSRIFDAAIDEFMVDKGLEWDGDFSWQEMATAVNTQFELPSGVPSADGVRRHCIIIGWTDTKQKVLPTEIC
ncbi:hypothetical protein AB1Y20_002916 [Prymnesium parvum]|uniref:Uncharacterized protein n=1 Tax=Prymnesium parvum TaxID=97485 RepID=A0AB34JAX9_PRYPA